MKKLLLGSTALVVGGLMAAPAMAADPIKIGVGGYYTFYAGAGSIGSTFAGNGTVTTYKGLDFFQEGEIHFIGQSKLDNGTTVGLRVELEGWNPSSATANAQIDEAFLFAFGDWGRVEFGAKDSAAYIMQYVVPSALIGFGFFNPNHAYLNNSVAANNKAVHGSASTTIENNFQDVNRINYYTPRFAGLQLGIGYAPKLNVAAPGGQVANGTALAGAICGYANAANQTSCPSADYSYQDVLSLGANYLNKFGDVSLALSAGYSNATFVPGFASAGAAGSAAASAANQVTGANMTNWKAFVVGANVSFAGFTLGGVYGWDNNGLGANYFTNVDNDTRYYGVGLMYETGPWQVSAGWAGFRNTNGNGSSTVATIAAGTNAQTLNTAAATGVPGTSSTAFGGGTNSLAFGTETMDKYEVGANYALGPGIKLTGGFTYFQVGGPSNAVSGDSWVVLLGMDLRF